MKIRLILALLMVSFAYGQKGTNSPFSYYGLGDRRYEGNIENGKAHQGSSDYICRIVHAQIDSGGHNSENIDQEQALYQALYFWVLNPLLSDNNQGPKNNSCRHGMSARERITALFDQMRKTRPASVVNKFNQLNQNPM